MCRFLLFLIDCLPPFLQMLDYNVPGGVCRNMIYNKFSTLFNLTLCAKAFSLLDWIVGRKAEPRTICHWQLQVTERRKRTNKWWGFSRMRAWLVHWMGMATEYFFSLLADPDSSLMIITTTVISLLLHQNFCPILTMSLAASSIFSSSWWHYGQFCYTPWSTLLVQAT